jgi:hypothetical protein
MTASLNDLYEKSLVVVFIAHPPENLSYHGMLTPASNAWDTPETASVDLLKKWPY